MDSLQLSGSIDAQLESLEPDRLDDLASSAGKSLQHLGEGVLQSPDTVSSAVAAPLDLPVPEVMHIVNTNTHVGVGSEGLSLGTELTKASSLIEAEEPSCVPALFLTEEIGRSDSGLSVLRFLDNAGCDYYKTVSRRSLEAYLPDCMPREEKSRSMFALRSRKPADSSEPASPANSTLALPELDIRTVLHGNAMLWECARAADLLPQDPRDLMIAVDVWMTAMDLLAKARATKGTEVHRHKNRELRWFILDLKRIEATLCQISVPGQVVPSVLGGGKLSFADYAVTRLYEVLLDDLSDHRLPYTRQKKYPKIIEIASHVMAKRMVKQNSRARESFVDHPMGLQPWHERVEMYHSKPGSTTGFTNGAGVADSTDRAAAATAAYSDTDDEASSSCSSSDFSSSSTVDHIRKQTAAFGVNAHTLIGGIDNAAGDLASFPAEIRAEHIIHIPGVQEPKNFVYCCDANSPLRNFLHLFGEVVAKRKSRWEDASGLSMARSDPVISTLLSTSESSKYNFLAVYTGRRSGQIRLCSSLAEMLSHKKLYSPDSLVDRASVEVMTFLLQPREKAIIPMESWVRLETALKLESEYNSLLPALARELSSDERLSNNSFPLLFACEIKDPRFVELAQRW